MMDSFPRARCCRCSLLLAGCGGSPWNDPYPASERGANILYSSFCRAAQASRSGAVLQRERIRVSSRRSTSRRCSITTSSGPTQLVPFAATEVPRAVFFDGKGRRLPDDADAKLVAYSVYEIHIRPGILYQPHPAFAVDANGKSAVLPAQARRDSGGISALRDFPQQRHARADGRRLRLPDQAPCASAAAFADLRPDERVHRRPEGVCRDPRTRRTKACPRMRASTSRATICRARRWSTAIPTASRCSGKYPQFVYWLAMPFFAPVPPEADRFYAQPGMAEKNLTLDWYPVGTGPYMLTENNPEPRAWCSTRNPNFRGEPYPSEGEPGDAAAGLLADAGKPLPFIDKVVFSREKESIPYWNKFLQGYYDASGIASDTFDQAVQVSGQGEAALSPADGAAGHPAADLGRDQRSYYLGFNMLDPVVGGDAERARKLRQAISIAIDGRNSSRSSRTAAASRRRGRSRRASSATARAGTASIRRSTTGSTARRAAQADRGRQSSCWPRPVIPTGATPRPASRWSSTSIPPRRGRGGKSRLDWYRKQFAEDRRAAGDARHRLQPLPGQDPQGQRAALLPGLERRLSGSGEFPVPAARAAEQGQVPAARMPRTTPIRSSTACSSR